jgi:hypothetical protein
MASSIDLRQLDPCSASAVRSCLFAIERLASTCAAVSNAARRPRVGASELATRRSFEVTAPLPWSGMEAA